MEDAVGGAGRRNIKEGDPWFLRGRVVYRDRAAPVNGVASCTVHPDRPQQLACLHEVSLEYRHTHPFSSVAALKLQKTVQGL